MSTCSTTDQRSYNERLEAAMRRLMPSRGTEDLSFDPEAQVAVDEVCDDAVGLGVVAEGALMPYWDSASGTVKWALGPKTF